MSNTVNRPRKRPRKRSSNFRSLWALLWREAAYKFLVGRFGYEPGHPTRTAIWRTDSRRLRRLIARTLRAYPERRTLP